MGRLFLDIEWVCCSPESHICPCSRAEMALQLISAGQARAMSSDERTWAIAVILNDSRKEQKEEALKILDDRKLAALVLK